MELIKQEVSSERYIPIPDEVRDIYRLWRPTPLIRAVRLEKALGTPAHIYYKNESVSPSGSHKLNTSVPQAYYNKQEGIQSISTETGAGQWGCALAIAGDMFKMAIDIYMVKISYQQKPYRRSVMQAYGATVTPSPSDHTAAGRMILERNPNSTGSLGIAISEAVEVAATSGGKTKYSLGSVLNHVLLHQTVIGQEALDAMAEIGEYPDVVIGCVGGGSNFGGIALPFLHEDADRGGEDEIPGDRAELLPDPDPGHVHLRLRRHRGLDPAGQDVHPGPRLRAGIHPRRRPALSRHVPAHLTLVNAGYIEPRAYGQNRCFEAAIMFARNEGIIPAPESSHAIRAAIDEALAAKETGEKKVILFNLSGHGHFDMAAYDAYLAGQLTDNGFSAEAMAKSLATVPEV